MIRHEVTFFDHTLFLSGQFSEDLAQVLAELLVKTLPAVLRDPDHMVLALPDRVA
jgi:hypothetical protein